MYVNEDVDAHLVEFDRVFKYDILAYVSKDATEATITDKLVDALEFADGTADPDKAAVASEEVSKVVTAIQAKDSNNQLAASSATDETPATVTTDGIDVSNLATVSIADNTLTVKFADDSETTDNELAEIQVSGFR